MRTWCSFALMALIAGCGGAEARPAAPSAPAESPRVLELRSAADSVCHCPDDGCAQPALEKLLAREAELSNPADQTGLDAEHDRAIDCYARIANVPSAAELIPLMQEAADQVCACADEACARAVVERLRGQLSEKSNAVFTTRDQATLEAAGARLEACATKLAK
jgi:hypothetical protein